MWYWLVRYGLVEAVAELVWEHIRDRAEVDLETTILCNLAKVTQ